MPIYEYNCGTCEYKFDKLQSMAADGADCPRCRQPADRTISLFSAVTTGDDGELSSVPGGGGCGACSGGGCACSMS